MIVGSKLSKEDFEKLLSQEQEKKKTCKCGNIVKITNGFGRIICQNCGYYVFLDKKEEFIYRVKEKMKK